MKERVLSGKTQGSKKGQGSNASLGECLQEVQAKYWKVCKLWFK